jgi:hypothetical protein
MTTLIVFSHRRSRGENSPPVNANDILWNLFQLAAYTRGRAIRAIETDNEFERNTINDTQQ